MTTDSKHPLPPGAGARTRAVHAGEGVDPVTGASAPNIVMATSFVTEAPLGFSINAFDDEPPFFYSRWGNPTVAALESKLAALEMAEAGLAFASGMAATAAVLLTELSAGDHLIISEINYPGTAELARQTLTRFGISLSAVDTTDVDAVRSALRPNTRMIWVETPANPILQLTDIAAVAALAREAKVALAVDSTFATPMATTPLTLGADYVVHSLTKYIGGHGDCLGGMVLASSERIERLRTEALVHQGGVLSPFNAWLIARGVTTLPLRMAAHADNALTVARMLEAHPAVTRVLYPGLPSHPQYTLAQRQMHNCSGMVSFCVAGDGPALAQRCADMLQIIHYAVSLGHQRSLIYWIDTDALLTSAFDLSAAASRRYRDIAGAGVFRLSVGLEDPQDLCNDLDRVLQGSS